MSDFWVSQIHRHGFWYVDIPRTSSSSIKVELGKRFGLPYGKSNLIEKEHSTRQAIADHITARQMKSYLGPQVWERIFTFTFVRNPWDRLVSMYFFRLKKGHFSEDLTFRDYVLRLRDAMLGSRSELFAYHAFHLGCCDYILDESSNNLISFVGKYETRQADIRKIGQQIGYPDLGDLFIQSAARDKEHYSHYYDEETVETVRTLYGKEISMFGYSFDDSA